jgi:hypothetical protein
LKYYAKLEYKENKDYRHYRYKYNKRCRNFDNNLQHKEQMEQYNQEHHQDYLPMEHLMHELQRWNDYSDHEVQQQTEWLVDYYLQNEIMAEMEYSSQDN